MKWLQATWRFVFVSAGVFFIAGWCLLPTPLLTQPEDSRWDRLELLQRMDWPHNWWGYALGPAAGAFSVWLTFRRAGRKSAS